MTGCCDTTSAYGSTHFSVNEAESDVRAAIEQTQAGKATLVYGQFNIVEGFERLGMSVCHHDPRWDAVRENPRFQRMMTTVKADVDAQRAQLEQRESPDDFVKRLDRVRAAESATDQY